MTDPVFNLLVYAWIAPAIALISVQLTIVAPVGGDDRGRRTWMLSGRGRGE